MLAEQTTIQPKNKQTTKRIERKGEERKGSFRTLNRRQAKGMGRGREKGRERIQPRRTLN